MTDKAKLVIHVPYPHTSASHDQEAFDKVFL